MKRILFALIVACLCISPAFAYYTYQSNYSVPLGSSICIPSNYNGGATDFYAAWYSNDPWDASDPPNPGFNVGGGIERPFNASGIYWSTTQTAHWTDGNSQCINMPNYKTVYMTQSNGTHWDGRYGIYYFNTTDPSLVPAPPIVDYTCNFDSAFPYRGSPFDLACSDNSTSYPVASSWIWNLTQPDSTTYITSGTSLAKTLYPYGWYQLDFKVCNAVGCGYKNTTQLINISATPPAATGINLIVHTYDATKHAKVAPSNINIQNTTSGTWSNWTATGGTMTFTSTDEPTDTELLSVGQTVKLCGYAPGYAQTCGNLTIPYNNYEHTINLIATEAVPTGGNSTIIVSVVDGRTYSRIAGATVSVSNITAPYSSSKVADAAGVATFSNIPYVAKYQITASKTGYQTATTFWPVASGEVTNMWISILPTGETPVPTDTYGNPIYETPTTRITLAPGATPTLTDDQKDDAMMGILRDNGETLIKFFILCFILYMIMGIGGRR